MTFQKNVLAVAAVAAGVSLLGGVSSVEARQGADDVNEHAAISTVGVTVTREQAIATAQAKLAGTVKKAQLEREHGKKTWQVRIISTDGTQRGDFRIDAMTGSVLRERIKTIGSADRAVKLAEKAEKRRLKLEEKKTKFEERMKKKEARRAERETRHDSNDD